MNDDNSAMTEVVYDLKGGALPGKYTFALWDALVRALPWLETEEQAGLLPLRGAHNGNTMLLPQRAKLVLRLPQRLVQKAKQLSGQTLDVAGHELQIGAARERPLMSHPTLRAHLVASEDSEVEFLEEVEARLRELEIPCKWICGKQVVLQDEGHAVTGYSLVVYELNPEGSLRLQQSGLGGERRYGCGLFIPHKDIPKLD